MNETNNNSEQQGYNGWSNYETWAVALWLGNDQGTYALVRDLVTTSRDETAAAQALQGLIEEQNPLADQASLYSDLLSASLNDVDWHEVALSFIEE